MELFLLRKLAHIQTIGKISRNIFPQADEIRTHDCETLVNRDGPREIEPLSIAQSTGRGGCGINVKFKKAVPALPIKLMHQEQLQLAN